MICGAFASGYDCCRCMDRYPANQMVLPITSIQMAQRDSMAGSAGRPQTAAHCLNSLYAMSRRMKNNAMINDFVYTEVQIAVPF